MAILAIASQNSQSLKICGSICHRYLRSGGTSEVESVPSDSFSSGVEGSTVRLPFHEHREINRLYIAVLADEELVRQFLEFLIVHCHNHHILIWCKHFRES